MKNFEGKNTVVFDLDGTLLNTLEDLKNSTNYALTKYGYPQRTLDEIRSFVGNGVRLLMERALPDGANTSDFEEIFDCFKEHYKHHSLDFTKPYEGITEMLRDVKALGYKTAIVSNKLDSAVKELAARFFGDKIDVAIGERDGMMKKPAPDSVFLALKLLGSTADEAVYVGDSDVDVMTAKNAGLDMICVTWGFRDRHLLESMGAEVFADAPSDITEHLS